MTIDSRTPITDALIEIATRLERFPEETDFPVITRVEDVRNLERAFKVMLQLLEEMRPDGIFTDEWPDMAAKIDQAIAAAKAAKGPVPGNNLRPSNDNGSHL